MPKQKPSKVENVEPEEQAVVDESPVETVRVYEVTSSILVYKFDLPQDQKRKGEQVASVEFVPPLNVTVEDLEKRYVEVGGMKLVETITRAEWDKRKAK